MLDNLALSEFERSQLDSLIEALSDKPSILKNFVLNLSLEGKKINFARACEILMQSIKSFCALKARKYTIKQKNISQYEEDYILTKFCFVKDFGNLPKWFINLY